MSLNMEPQDLQQLHDSYRASLKLKDEVLDQQREQIKRLQETATRLRDEKQAVEEAQRVVLVKPGDILLIGNVGDKTHRLDKIGGLIEAFAAFDFRVAVFEADIDLDVLSMEELTQIVADRVKGAEE